MIVDCISDLHGFFPELEGGDLLIVAGDLTVHDSVIEHEKFLEWLSGQLYRKKVYIAGNHDGFYERPLENYKSFPNIHYLEDSGIDLESMEGFRKRHPIDEGYIKIGWLSWEKVNSDLKFLLNRSDSEGHMSSQECAAVFPVLRQVLALWCTPEYKDDKIQGLQLADAMEHCAKFKKKLNFC